MLSHLIFRFLLICHRGQSKHLLEDQVELVSGKQQREHHHEQEVERQLESKLGGDGTKGIWIGDDSAILTITVLEHLPKGKHPKAAKYSTGNRNTEIDTALHYEKVVRWHLKELYDEYTQDSNADKAID